MNGKIRIQAGFCAAGLALVIPLLAACGSKSDGPPEFPEVQVREPSAEALAKGTVLRGEARFEGTVRNTRISMGSDAVCQAANEGAMTEDIVSEDGKLRDVLVYVSSGLEDYTFDWEREAALLDQKGCVYVPHVLAVRTRQPVKFLNSDNTLHNINSLGGAKENQGFNRTTTTKGSFFHWQFPAAELGIRVKCDVHPWMQAVIHVLDHPYFAVSDAEGRWALPRPLPPGSYTLAALHPVLGSQSVDIQVVEGEEAAVGPFVFKR